VGYRTWVYQYHIQYILTMGAGTLKSLQYRTFDELLGSVMVDFANWNSDNVIEPAELIKIAQKCNYQLGLKINQTKETILEVEHNRAKLPADFYQLNIALLCSHYTTVVPYPTNGIQTQNVQVYTNMISPNLTTCPCWTVVSSGAQADVIGCDGTKTSVYFPPNDDGTAKTTKICATSIDTANAHPLGQLTVSTSSFCYHDYNTGTETCDKPADICGTCNLTPCTCNSFNPDPWFQDKVYSLCDDTVGVKVIQECQYEVRHYTEFAKLYMVPAKEATAFCVNTQFRDCANTGQIKDGFIQLSLECGKLYICYEGAMENEQGELLVLDHPLINEFYEWSLKYRILSNLYLNGEPDIERRLSMCKEELRVARIQAMSITSMPDYRDLTMSIDARRSNMHGKFFKPFERYFYPYSIYGYNQQGYYR